MNKDNNHDEKNTIAEFGEKWVKDAAHLFNTESIHKSTSTTLEACVTLLATPKNAPYSYDTLIGYQVIKLVTII